MTDAHEHTNLTGPAAAEADRRLEEFAGRADFHGTVITDPRRLLRLMRRDDPAIYPGTYVTCVFDPAKALCLRGGDTGQHPDLNACRPLDCRNVALTTDNTTSWQTEIDRITQRLESPPPLQPLLHSDRLHELTRFLDRHRGEPVP